MNTEDSTNEEVVLGYIEVLDNLAKDASKNDLTVLASLFLMIKTVLELPNDLQQVFFWKVRFLTKSEFLNKNREVPKNGCYF